MGHLLIVHQKKIFNKYISTHPEMADEIFKPFDVTTVKRSVMRGIPWLGGFILCSFLALYLKSEIAIFLLAFILVIGAVWPWRRMVNGLFLNLGSSFTLAYKRGIVIMVGAMYLVAGLLMYMSTHS
jgi:hypothetical protein